MLEDDVVAATKTMIASAFGGRNSGGGKGKGSRQDEDTEHKCHDGVQIHASGTRGKASLNPRHLDNPNLDNDNEQVRFTISPAQLLPIILSLLGFTWLPSLLDDFGRRDKSRFYEYQRDVKHKTNSCF